MNRIYAWRELPCVLTVPKRKMMVFLGHKLGSQRGHAVIFNAVYCWTGTRNQLVAQYHTRPLALEDR